MYVVLFKSLLPLLLIISRLSALAKTYKKIENKKNPDLIFGNFAKQIAVDDSWVLNQNPSDDWKSDKEDYWLSSNLNDLDLSMNRNFGKESEETSDPFDWYAFLSESKKRNEVDDGIGFTRQNRHHTLTDYKVCKLDIVNHHYEDEVEYEYRPRILKEIRCVSVSDYNYRNIFSNAENSEFCIHYGKPPCQTKFKSVTVFRRKRNSSKNSWEIAVKDNFPNGCACNKAFYFGI